MGPDEVDTKAAELAKIAAEKDKLAGLANEIIARLKEHTLRERELAGVAGESEPALATVTAPGTVVGQSSNLSDALFAADKPDNGEKLVVTPAKIANDLPSGMAITNDDVKILAVQSAIAQPEGIVLKSKVQQDALAIAIEKANKPAEIMQELSKIKPTAPGKALRASADKLAYHLIPPEFDEILAAVCHYGAQKYTPRNFELGLPPDDLIRGSMSHLNFMRRGEWLDRESLLPHAAHAAWNMLVFAMQHARGLEAIPEPTVEGYNSLQFSDQMILPRLALSLIHI